MANELAKTGAAYGGLMPTVQIGVEDFAAHDSTKTWSDNGAAGQLAASFATDIEAHAAEQVKQGMMEVLLNAFLDLRDIEGKPTLVVDGSNDHATLMVGWDPEQTYVHSAADAFQNNDPAFASAILVSLQGAWTRIVELAEQGGHATVLQTAEAFVRQVGASFRAPVAAAPRGQARSQSLRGNAVHPGRTRPSAHNAAPPSGAIPANTASSRPGRRGVAPGRMAPTP